MTVWEFEIDPPYVDALPQDGATYTFTATIRPSTDHNGNSMARIIEFGLGSSSEPGYCLNATRIQGRWTDTSAEDNDLKFVPDQPGLDVFAEDPNPTNFCHARTKKPETSISVQVRCLDYGAYGTIWAYAYGLGLARLKGTLIERGAEIPLDQRNGLDDDGDGKVDEDLLDLQDNDGDGRIDEEVHGNYIYDGWQWNNGAATDDNDADPQGDGTRGDGLSRYEEYRGIEIIGEANDGNEGGDQQQHIRLNPMRKEIFVSIGQIIRHAGYFPGAGMPTIYLLDFDSLPDKNSFAVNFYSSLARLRIVYSIRVYPRITNINPPVEIRYGYCTQAIWSGQREFDPFGVPGFGPTAVIHDWQIWTDASDVAAARRYVVGHEIGHSVLWHQPNWGHHLQGTDFCLMRIPLDLRALPYPTEFCVQNPGCQSRWKLNP